MYTSQTDAQLQVQPSDFAFVYVESSDPNTGASSTYTFTLTFGVDTPQGTELKIQLPDEVRIDTSVPTTATGLQNLNPSTTVAINTDANRLQVNLLKDVSLGDLSNFVNGTTIQFAVNKLVNPLSLKSSGYFEFYTFDDNASQPYKYNENEDAVKVVNSLAAPITFDEPIALSNEELDADTAVTIKVTTTNAIPADGKLLVTFPPNIILTGEGEEAPQMDINGNIVTPEVNYDSKTFLVSGLPVDQERQFAIHFPQNLRNPSSGPYAYTYWVIEFQDRFGYVIDKVIAQDDPASPSVACLSNCDTCAGTLSTCQSCSFVAALNKSFYLKGTECLEDCGDGFFQETGYVCGQCSGNCVTCRITAESCTLCRQDQPLIYADPATLTCHATCPEGTYLDEEAKICRQCESPCYTCSAKDACLSCDRTTPDNLAVFFFGAQNQCFEECPAGSVPTPAKQCDACTSPCATCEGRPDQCLTCVPG